MKINKKILALLIVFIAIVSVYAVSAEDIATDDIIASSNDAVVIEARNADEVLAASYDIPANATVSDIESIIANTSAGDTINFAENATYNFGELSSGVKIEHTLILQGNGATIEGYQGFSFEADEESIAGSQVYNLNFIMTNPILWNGRALEFFGGSDYIIEGCTFTNGNSGIYIRRPTGNVTIQNNQFFADEGATNASTIAGDYGKQETGSKAINLMGGSGITIIENTFEGDFLDAVSIASGAANVEMYSNTMNDVWYGVFYGGGITNITMQGNTFENSKAFAVGIIKAAGNSYINDNIFITESGKIGSSNRDKAAIYVEEGNTAHGAPSNIETIIITENQFLGEDSIAVAGSSKGGMITPKGEFTVINNAYDDGVTVFSFTDNNTYTFKTNNLVVEENNVTIEGNVPIKLSKVIFLNDNTDFEFGEVYDIMLIGEDNVVLADQEVTITITSGDIEIQTLNVTTNNYGIINLPLLYDIGAYNITVSYDGDEFIGNAYYTGIIDDNTFNIKSLPVIIVGADVTIPTKAKQKFEITLKDESNRLLPNKTVEFTVNGISYNRTTNENGIAGLNINLNMGDYDMTVKYTDNEGKIYIENYVLTAIQSNATIKSTPVTFQGKGNKFTAQLVDQLGQPLANEVVAFHINGVTYYRITDANGQFSIAINLNPGIYNMYMSYDGTFQYSPTNGGSQVTVI